MTFEIRKATKFASKLRLALIGISGSGKTYSSLEIASALGKKICLIDTEFGSASKYADKFNFDTLPLDSFSPLTYVEALEYVDKQGYDVVIVDSLSHAWMGKDGALEQVDKAAKRSQSTNTFAAWRDVTPQHNRLVDALLRVKAHLIVTMRAKSEYVMEEYEVNGRKKTKPVKVGLAPIQRDGLEYEFDVVGDMNLDNDYIVSKSRCSELHQAVINKPGKKLGLQLLSWLDGKPAPEPIKKTTEQLSDTIVNELGAVETTPRDYYEEVKTINNLEDLKKWFLGFPEELRQKGSEIYGAKESRKVELSTPPPPQMPAPEEQIKNLHTPPQEDAPAPPQDTTELEKELILTFRKIKETTPDKTLAIIDGKIESIKDLERRKVWIKRYEETLANVNNQYIPSILPF